MAFLYNMDDELKINTELQQANQTSMKYLQLFNF